MWDTKQYLMFAAERSRPFFDLLAQVRRDDVRTVADLGCGPGGLTRTLAERWPAAQVTGVDNAPEMLEKAQRLALPGRLTFVEAEVSRWRPAEPLDVIFSSAALHWVGDHAGLLRTLQGLLAPGGTLAVQMPRHFGTPAQQVVAETVGRPRWQAKLAGVGLHARSVQPLEWYVRELHGLGFAVDAWETTYIHILEGTNPVLEWLKGAALRPLLARLETHEAEDFMSELGEQLRRHYPGEGGRTLFPFPRIFFVASLRRTGVEAVAAVVGQ